ncbi:SPRY domain-containing SOCS box protein 3 [Patella vulgata]|uniref:SPRY domain-containing SOCS box protein 3 n=1 Tax=Patella vulgata TaxID=6465 RepID=UPI0024A7D4EB|nr:SPRY domain-containing SOCS box protein 3 [Patella vulgata]XP_050392843.2 SPRY domain-containing SOCS box protein 3 [Patella vulgata]
MEIFKYQRGPILSEFYANNWVWDYQNKSSDVHLSNDKKSAYFYTDPVDLSTGTAGVRGNKALNDGEHYWEIVFLEPPCGTSVMMGVGTENSKLQTNNYKYVNLIGIDQESWGLSYKGRIYHNGESWKYCDPIYDEGTIIGCHLNTYLGTLTFYRNGVNMGVAFYDRRLQQGQLYPIVSSTATETELGIGRSYCRRISLREKCCSIIRNNLSCNDMVDTLPLPNIVKSQIKMA